MRTHIQYICLSPLPLCVCVSAWLSMCLCLCVWTDEGQKPTCYGICLLLPLREFWGFSSGCQGLEEMPLPTEPSSWCYYTMFSFLIVASFHMQFSVRPQHCYAMDLEDVFHLTNSNSSSFFMSLATSALHSAFRGCEFDCSPCVLRANYITLLPFV